MRMIRLLAGLLAILGVQASAQPNVMEIRAAAAPSEPPSLPLGTGGVSGMPAVSWTDGPGGRSIRNVSQATLTPVLPDLGTATGAAVIVAPGGAFYNLSMDGEAWPTARALSERGIAVFILKYRLRPTPTRMEDYRAFLAERIQQSRQGELDLTIPPQSLEDGRAALRLIRDHAAEWNVDPKRIGMMGFSAGAMLTLGVTLASNEEEMPAFIAPIYGPMNAVTVPGAAPAMFAALAADDPLFGNQGYGLIESWQKAGKLVELHVFQSGGHGYGLGRPGTTTAGWIDGFVRWLEVNRMLQQTEGLPAAERPQSPPPGVRR